MEFLLLFSISSSILYGFDVTHRYPVVTYSAQCHQGHRYFCVFLQRKFDTKKTKSLEKVRVIYQE